jgi:hypothetical protein
VPPGIRGTAHTPCSHVTTSPRHVCVCFGRSRRPWVMSAQPSRMNSRRLHRMISFVSWPRASASPRASGEGSAPRSWRICAVDVLERPTKGRRRARRPPRHDRARQARSAGRELCHPTAERPRRGFQLAHLRLEVRERHPPRRARRADRVDRAPALLPEHALGERSRDAAGRDRALNGRVRVGAN